MTNVRLDAGVLYYSPLLYGLHIDDLKLAFHPLHWADLKKSDLSDETIKNSQVFSCRPCGISKILGWNPELVTSALAIPYLGMNFIRVKVFPSYKDKQGRSVKYLQRKGMPSRLYFPPGIKDVLNNSSIPLGIVEGEKKTLCAMQEGIFSIGIGGIWNWSHNHQPLPDFEKINWKGREVTLFPDGDLWIKPDVKKGTLALGQYLKSLGAIVNVGLLSQVKCA